MMDRASQQFTMHMRLWTVVLSVLLAFAFYLDMILLLEHVSHDSVLRNAVAAQTNSLKRQADTALSPALNDQNLQQMDHRLTDLSTQMSSPKLQLLGKGAPIHGWTGFGAISALAGPSSSNAFKHLSGILLSCMLLSFGAPFWFSQLKTLTNLRSVVVATREEQSRTPSSPAPGATSAIAARDLPSNP